VPNFVVVAGPNGSGKTTLTRYGREAFQQLAILDPDAIARGMSSTDDVDVSNIDAGRAVLGLAAELLEKQEDFLVETTLSGSTYLRMMRSAKDAGYTVILLFVGTESIDINLQRIRDRVAKGGHDVPEEDQRRRFNRCFAHMRKAIDIADEVTLYDNSGLKGHRKVAVKENGIWELIEPLPAWAEFLRTV
jgi:predicted ABC-type ATPase